MKKVKYNFIKCGITGMCLEVVWTSITGYSRKDRRLIGNTSLWMFPIYGMAAVIEQMNRLINHKSTFARGSFYSAGIYIMEFVTGMMLKRRNCCPWDYSKSRFNIMGIIRLDYAPLWFLVGLIYEKILIKEEKIMGNDDSVKLLRECDFGVKMGVQSMEDVMDQITGPDLKKIIESSLRTHSLLSEEIREVMSGHGIEEKNPGKTVKTMSFIKTNMKLAVENSDNTIAELMTDGCHMGIKSISRYINQYAKADEKVMKMAKKVRDEEEKLEIQLRPYL